MRANIFTLILINSCCMFSQTPANDPHWELVWEDEFNFFDNNKWIKANYALHLPEPQIYLASNVYTLDGNLVIKVNNQPTTCPPNPIQTTWACTLAQPGVTYPYNSGWVETNNNFNTQYGYIEAKIKLPHRYGFFPAFWTWRGNGVSTSNEAEIDIFEMLGSNPPNRLKTNVHIDYAQGNLRNLDIFPSNFSYKNQWHVYAVEWSPTKVIWYLNGNIIRVLNNPGVVDPVRTIFNMAIESGYPAALMPVFTDYMYVDYVRVWGLKKDCSVSMNVCNYNFNTHDNKVKQSIIIGNGSCSNALSIGSNVVLRASQSIEINGDFTVPVGAALYMDVNACD